MSKADWGYLLLTWLFVVWWFAARLDRLQLEYVSNRVRRETAELVGNKERATELREEERTLPAGFVQPCLPTKAPSSSASRFTAGQTLQELIRV
jgi:hypothetical protein